MTITISGEWSSADTTAVDISSITEGAYSLTIQATGSARHGGTLPNGSTNKGYLLDIASGDAITITQHHIIIDGLAIDAVDSDANGITIANYYTDITVKNCIFKVSAGDGVYVPQARGNQYYFNNICLGDRSANYNTCISPASGGDSGTYVYIYNNTSYGLGYGFSGSDASTAHLYLSNNAAFNSVNGSIYRPGYATGGSNNICSDTSCTTSPLTDGINSKTSYSDYFVSVTGGSEDFHLKAGSELINAGADLYGSGVTSDIDYDTLTVRNDIGADEYTGAPAATRRSPMVIDE
jgi:hypothetical protein